MNKFKYKVGDIVSGCGLIIEIKDINSSKFTFKGKILRNNKYSSHFSVGRIVEHWSTEYNWEYLKGYNTKLYKVIYD